jgi:hypothetical protein
MPPYILPFPRLVFEVWSDSSSTHGPNQLKAIVSGAAKMGWSWYSRFPASAFMSLRQDDPVNAEIIPGLDHLRVYYVNDATGYGPVLVFNGRFGDPDESGDDVVWTAWSYLAELALSRTGYEVYYKSKQIKTIVEDEWSRDESSGKFKDYGAKVRADSLLKHVTTGTIQNPKASNGSSEMLTDPQFGVIDVPRLLLFFDLTEIGRANTTQNTTVEISRSTTPTFNFWRDRGSAIAGKRLTYPGVIRDFRHVPGVVDVRNDLATIGQKKGKNVEIIATQDSGTYGITAFGRRQDTFAIKTLSGYPKLTDETAKSSAQVSITQRAVKEASQPTRALQLDVRPDLFEPFDGWDIEDTIDVEISRGRTSIDRSYRIVGVRGMLDRGGYRQNLFVTVPAT